MRRLPPFLLPTTGSKPMSEKYINVSVFLIDFERVCVYNVNGKICNKEIL